MNHHSLNPRPLDGVRVVELATFVAGPSCARFLADLGASVVKVEAPAGDPLRFTAANEGRPDDPREDVTYTLENSGKQFITLNIKTKEGREALERLIAQADIFITNNRRPALKKIGLDYESLKAKYPALVYGFVSGYGEKGPDANLPGFDFTAFFARGGILGTLYDKDSLPLSPIAGFGDHQVGMYLAAGLLAALYRAKNTGHGDQVTVSLFHSAIWDVSLMLQSAQYNDPSTQFPISRKASMNPLQTAHKTKDGRWLQIAMPSYNHYYPLFMPLIGHPELIEDGRFYPQTHLPGHTEEFYEILREAIAKKTLDEWADILTKADIPFARAQTWAELLQDPQAWESGCFASVDYPSGCSRTMVRTPVIFSDTEAAPYERAPYQGEQTRLVLTQLGYSEKEIAAMLEAKAAIDCEMTNELYNTQALQK